MAAARPADERPKTGRAADDPDPAVELRPWALVEFEELPAVAAGNVERRVVMFCERQAHGIRPKRCVERIRYEELTGLTMTGLTLPVRLRGAGRLCAVSALLTRGEKKVRPPPKPGESIGAAMGVHIGVLQAPGKMPVCGGGRSARGDGGCLLRQTHEVGERDVGVVRDREIVCASVSLYQHEAQNHGSEDPRRTVGDVERRCEHREHVVHRGAVEEKGPVNEAPVGKEEKEAKDRLDVSAAEVSEVPVVLDGRKGRVVGSTLR